MDAQGRRGSTFATRYAILPCLALIALWPVAALAGQDQAGAQAKNHIQHGLKIKNKTGKDANDLHIKAINKEADITMTGAKVTSNDWGDVDVKMNPPHGMTSDLKGGNIPNGGTTTIDFDFWTDKKNQIFIDYTWTKDGKNIGGGANGWDVKIPMKGGNGGLLGAQGGGGGVGNFVHKITIFNDMAIDYQLSSFAAYASMTRFGSVWDLDWSGIPGMLAAPIIIAANSSVSFDFETTGAYRGGQIYLQYEMDAPPGVEGDSILAVGVHPIPEPETYAMLLAGLGLLGLARRRRVRIG